jgi:hypothetical protein
MGSVPIPRDADMQYAVSHSVEPPYEVAGLFFLTENGDKPQHVTHVGMIHSTRLNSGVYIEDLDNHRRRKAFVDAGPFLHEYLLYPSNACF